MDVPRHICGRLMTDASHPSTAHFHFCSYLRTFALLFQLQPFSVNASVSSQSSIFFSSRCLGLTLRKSISFLAQSKLSFPSHLSGNLFFPNFPSNCTFFFSFFKRAVLIHSTSSLLSHDSGSTPMPQPADTEECMVPSSRGNKISQVTVWISFRALGCHQPSSLLGTHMKRSLGK